MCGVMLPADGPFLLGSRQLDPLYDEAQRLDAMVAVHATGSLRGRGSTNTSSTTCSMPIPSPTPAHRCGR